MSESEYHYSLGRVWPPNPPLMPQLLNNLIKAYSEGNIVTPIVVVEFENKSLRAICGSHRIAAAKEVFSNNIDIRTLGWLILSETQIQEQINKYNPSQWIKDRISDFLILLKQGKCRDYIALLEVLGPYLDPIYQEALKDQDGFSKEFL